LSYEDRNEEVRTRTSEATAELSHSHPFNVHGLPFTGGLYIRATGLSIFWRRPKEKTPVLFQLR